MRAPGPRAPRPPRAVKHRRRGADEVRVTWLAAAGTATLLAATLWGLGGSLLVAWRATAGRLETAVLAPLVTLGLAAAVAVVAARIGVPWGPLTLLVPAAALLGAGLVVHARRRPEVVAPPRPLDRPLLAAVGTGVLLQVVPVIVGLGRPNALPGAFDAVAHTTLLRWIHDTGDASSLHALGAWRLTGRPGYYPAAWHAVASLVPARPDLAAVVDASITLFATVPWTLGITLLARVAFPARPRTWRWAAVLSAAPLSLPVYLALAPSGLVPNAVAAALLPGVLALSLLALRRPGTRTVACAAVAWVGLGATHPNTVLATALALAPAAATALAGAVRRLDRPPAVRAAVATGALGVPVLAFAVLRRSSVLHAVSGYDGRPPLPFLDSLGALLGGAVDNGGYAGGGVVVLAAVLGLWASRRCTHARGAAGALVVTTVVLLLVSSPPSGLDLGGPWYGEPRRFAPVTSACLVPFAALALDAGTRAVLVAARRARPALRADRRTADVVTGALVAVAVVLGPVGLAQVARTTFHGSASQPVVADDDELAMLHRLPAELGPGRVLGLPLSGAGYLQGVVGVPTLPLSGFPPDEDDARELVARVRDLGTDPALCAAVRRWDVRYVYVDPVPMRLFDGQRSLPSPPPGSTLVDRGGSASVWRLGVCW